MAREILKIKTYVDGVNDIPFPSEEEQIGITEYTYTSKRMGGVTLSATLMCRECLDKKWTGLQYVEFRGEKYFISATPSSGKDNEDARYEHTLSFVPERELKLNNVYFYDAVSDESTGDDKYKSNSTKVVFFGTIQEFVARLNESLKYSGLDYTVVIDEGITSEGKLMSFEDQFFFNVLQEIYNTYELPFYFVGKVIHIGFTSNAITQTFKYGFENELLSIKKNNANYRIINRCTGIGSEDNIPYYYPNNSPKGDIAAQAGASNTGVLQNDIRIIDPVLFAEKFDLVNSLKYEGSVGSLDVSLRHGIYKGSGGASYSDYTQGSKFELTFPLSFPQYTQNLMTIVSGSVSAPVKRKFRLSFGYKWLGGDYNTSVTFRQRVSNATENCIFQDGTDEFFHLEITEAGDFQFIIQTMITITAGAYTDQNAGYAAKYELSYTVDWQPITQWTYNGKDVDNIEDMGISIGDAVPEDGDTIKQVLQQYIIPSKNLMPSVYRETLGAERFYNALNDTYTNPETGEKYVFENEYDPMIPREHKQEFEEIKPTIKGMKNASGQRMDQILDIEFDEDDNDEVDEEGNYLHPHFFVKLPKYDGDYGFNLFDHAIEEEEMSFSMTSGQCGACEFKVKVDKDTMKNPVQVNSSGSLMRDENGNVITSGEFQDRQNDTSEYEVWIALEKEESTYGQIMPNVRQNLKPAAGDSFVILHIDLPQAYILNAENELKEAIIKYMAQNNSEKFNFSINFSRIYLEENPEIESQLNENARIQVEYDGIKYDFYISQYTYKCLDEEALPEITVEITDTITVNKTTLQNTADSIKQDMNDALGNIDFLTMGLRYFVRKDIDDEVIGKIRFRKGIEFGNYSPGPLGSGGAVYTDENNSSHMEIDFLTVRRKAEFTSISVQELKHIGGQLILSPAAMVCSSVEDVGAAYRCYFKTGREDDGDVGSTIFNEFVVGDQARIQNFNQLEIRYYWRLVVGVGDDYIDLSKTDCDSGSVEPRAGDNIVQLGNRDDVTRQAAQILSCYGSNAPSYIMYNGINSYSLEGKNITGIIYNPESGEPQFYSFGQMFFGDRNIEDPSSTFITFQQKEGDTKKRIYVKGGLTLTEGSSGLSNLEEWPEVEAKINKAIAGTDVEYYSSTSPTELIGGVWSTTAPQWTPGRYIWSRTKVSYADGTSSYTDPVCISGNDGDGQGITKITEYYYLSTSPTELVGGEWSTEAPSWVDGSYIWTKSRLQYADGSTVDTDPICVTGPKGEPGGDGKPGTSVLAQYSADGSLWHDSYQEGDIWMRTSNDNGVIWSSAIKIVGEDGKPGEDGSYVVVQFAKNTSTTQAPASGWQDTPPSALPGEYVWIRMGTVVPPALAPSSWRNPIRITGDAGHDGEDVYLLDLSNEVATVSCDIDGNVLSDMPECTAKVYKGGSGSIAYSGFTAQFIGCSGTINKASGIINLTQITADTAQVIVTVEKAGPSGPELTATMTITKVYPGDSGQDGAPGEDAVLYYLLPSADKITKGFTGKIDPESITCEKYRQVGNQTAVIDDTSSIVIKYQRLGEDTYEKTYTGAVEVTADTTAVVFTLYDGSTLIDRERIPVLTDASDLEIGSGNLLKYTAFTNMDGLVSRDCSHMVVPDTSAYDNDGQKSARIETFSAMTSAAGTHTISSVTVYYARKTETGNIASLSWSTSRSSLTATYRYLYAQLRITYSDGTSGRTVPVLIGQYYSNNAISSVSPYYLATSDETASPYEGSWAASRPTLTSSSIYMYVHFRTTYGDGTVSKSVAVNAGCYNKTGLELLMWPENLKKDRNLMFSFSVRGVSGSRMYITIDGAETEAMTEAGGWITVNLSTSWSRYTVDFGKITSFSRFEKSRLRIIFSATGQYHFNTPILSYGTIQGDWTPAHEDVEYKMTDLEYLRTLFPNSTLVSGATISQMAVVTNGDPEDGGTVVAGLNGTDIGKDTSDDNHGKVLIFAGSEGADDAAIQAAQTKIYEDGYLETENANIKGRISSTSGEIAGFTIDNNTFSASNTVDDTEIILSSDVHFWSGNDALIFLKHTKLSKSDGSISALRLSYSAGFTPEEAYAVFCDHGMFAGLRPKTRFITGSTTLTEYDFTVFVYALSGTITLTLRSSPENGQTYFILKESTSFTLRIDGNGKSIHRMNSNDFSVATIDTSYFGLLILAYSSEDDKWWLAPLSTY